MLPLFIPCQHNTRYLLAFMHDRPTYWHVGLAVKAPGDNFLVTGLARCLVEGNFSRFGKLDIERGRKEHIRAVAGLLDIIRRGVLE